MSVDQQEQEVPFLYTPLKCWPGSKPYETTYLRVLVWQLAPFGTGWQVIDAPYVEQSSREHPFGFLQGMFYTIGDSQRRIMISRRRAGKKDVCVNLPLKSQA